MINVIPSEERFHADHGWLDTRWHFSFGDYHDPANMNWSALRVFVPSSQRSAVKLARPGVLAGSLAAPHA